MPHSLYSTPSPVKFSITGVLKFPVRPPHKTELALTITEHFCPAAVQPEQTLGVLEMTEQEPPQSETTSYEKEVPQLPVGSIQVTENEDTPTSVTITSVGGGGAPVRVKCLDPCHTVMLFTCYSQEITANHGSIFCTYHSLSIHVGTDNY